MHKIRETTLFGTLRVLIFINQCMGLAPAVRVKDATNPHRLPRFRSTQRLRHVCTVLQWFAMTCAAPYLIMLCLQIYQNLSVSPDAMFNRIAAVTFASDISVSLMIVAVQLWQRHQVVTFLNALAEILEDFVRAGPAFVTWRLLLLVWMKIGFIVYDVLLHLLFFALHVSDLTAMQCAANLIILYIQQVRFVFGANVFTVIVLLDACYQRMEIEIGGSTSYKDYGLEEAQLKRMTDCHRLVFAFTRTFQLGLCLLVIGLFIDLLANLYALIYYYVITHGLWYTFVVYAASIAIEIYFLMLVTHLCCHRQRQVRDLLIERMQKLELSTPWLMGVEFRVLGLFSLGHEFWSFLVSYSVSFIVIILQFGYKKFRGNCY